MEKGLDEKTLLDAYRVPGFRARTWVSSDDREPAAFVVALDRRSNKPKYLSQADSPFTVTCSARRQRPRRHEFTSPQKFFSAPD
jgi:hypothetical protein